MYLSEMFFYRLAGCLFVREEHSAHRKTPFSYNIMSTCAYYNTEGKHTTEFVGIIQFDGELIVTLALLMRRDYVRDYL